MGNSWSRLSGVSVLPRFSKRPLFLIPTVCLPYRVYLKQLYFLAHVTLTVEDGLNLFYFIFLRNAEGGGGQKIQVGRDLTETTLVLEGMGVELLCGSTGVVSKALPHSFLAQGEAHGGHLQLCVLQSRTRFRNCCGWLPDCQAATPPPSFGLHGFTGIYHV